MESGHEGKNGNSSGDPFEYAELAVTTNFSFLHGASHPEEFVYAAKALGYSAIAITDSFSLGGIVRAHKAAKDLSFQLIVGTRIRLHKLGDPNELLPYSLLLYPTCLLGYQNLCQLLSTGKLRAKKGECHLTLYDLKKYEQGLIAIVCIDNLKAPLLESSLQELDFLKTQDRLSLAMSRHYQAKEQKELKTLAAFSRAHKIPLIAINDTLYHSPSRKKLQDVLTCIRHGTTIKSAGFLLAANAERHLKSPKEMHRLFAKQKDALDRIKTVVQQTAPFSLSQLRYEYPKELTPENLTSHEYLTQLTWQGANERYGEGIPEKVKKQIEYELTLISELNYAPYFLTVFDIITFARTQRILCQGRGAAANSAVCFCLGITSVDPDRMNLLVERFISKERDEPPDIDIDFEHSRREEVIQYIYKKYGRERATLTATIITYRSKSAFRDVGKVFGLSPEDSTFLRKTLRRAPDPATGRFELLKHGLNPDSREVFLTIELAELLKGFPRHRSQHVGGFVISEHPISAFVPIENATMDERTVMEWEKDDLEQMGVLKIDILALGMLTAIRKSLSLIHQAEDSTLSRHFNYNLLLLHNIPPEDPEVYEMLSLADTIGVFQVESRAQMSMLPRLQPRCFFDLVIQVAIVRPGPIQGGMVHPYLRRRSGKEPVTYPNERIKDILSPTLGVPIFQEQIMQIAVVAAGFTPGEADSLRRAMANWKRNKGLIAQFGSKLLSGMKQNGYSDDFAKRIVQQIHGFSEYGFPLSHAASFALIVYVAAWLKKHHPAAFAAGLLNSQPMGFYLPAQIIQDAKNHGVTVLPVDIQESDWGSLPIDINSSQASSNMLPQVHPNATASDKALQQQNGLRLGMSLISGLKRSEAEKVTALTTTGRCFPSIKALWRESGISVASLKLLARADTFQSFNLSRQEALWEINKFNDAPLPLFCNLNINEPPALLPVISLQQHVMKDYASIGLSLKAHPVSFIREFLSRHNAQRNKDLKNKSLFPHGARTSAAGLVLVRQRPSTASGVVFVTLEDETGTINLIIRTEIFKKHEATICDSTCLIAQGTIQHQENVLHLLAKNFLDCSLELCGLESQSRDFH